jgi:hypothetical protein
MNSKAAQEVDIPKRKQCLEKGQRNYNAAQTDPKERRANDCNYSDLRLGGKPGKRRRILCLQLVVVELSSTSSDSTAVLATSGSLLLIIRNVRLSFPQGIVRDAVG